jgi:hypothetical protein
VTALSGSVTVTAGNDLVINAAVAAANDITLNAGGAVSIGSSGQLESRLESNG